jgi:lysophospholipase
MDPELAQPSDESRVLIIYTGGTIGMLVGQQGYVPEPHFLTETLRSQTRFHDPLQDSLFSNSGSVEGFRTWTLSGGSGRASPISAAMTPTHATPPLHTLLVRSSRPIGNQFLGSGAKKQSPCVKVAENVYEAPLPSLVTPSSSVPGSSGRKRIRYAILEWDPLLDSSNIDIDEQIGFGLPLR